MTALKRVLIVDDSVQMHLAYKMILTRYQCEIIEALNGQEGVHKLADNPDVNLMIIDINMPLMSGLEFVKTVKDTKRYDHVPIIIASTAGMEKEADACLTLGARGRIKKPFTSNELHSLITSVFSAVNNGSQKP